VAAISFEIDQPGRFAADSFKIALRDVLPEVEPRVYWGGWTDEVIDVMIDASTRESALTLAEDTGAALERSDVHVRVLSALALRKA
jgi:hypothetical protein